MALKTKKHYEKELIKISNVKQNLITQQSYLDSASMDVEALKAMKAGADALKASHAGLYGRAPGTHARCAREETVPDARSCRRAFGWIAALERRDARKVEDLMEDIDEQMALKNEVSDAISRPFAGTEVDEVRACPPQPTHTTANTRTREANVALLPRPPPTRIAAR